MATISEALAIAVQYHNSGQLQIAEQIYRQILQADPNHVDAIHLLGVIACQTGKPEVAVEYIRQAIRLNGDSAAFYCNLGNALKDLKKLDEAADSYRRAVELQPNFAEALSNLGGVLKDLGMMEESIDCCHRALALNPNLAGVHSNLGSALMDQGKHDEGAACCRRALELNPNFAEAHNNLSIALRNQGKLDEAIACCHRALELNPNYPEANLNLGITLRDQGLLDDAVACYRRAVQLKPDYAEAHNNLGNVLGSQGKLDDAVACYHRALELKPDMAEAYNNLGNVLKDQGMLEDAVACYHRALEPKPDYCEAHANLGNVFTDQLKMDEAVACYRRALELKPDYSNAHSNLLGALQYSPTVTPAVLAEAHAEFDRRHAEPLRGAFAPHDNNRDRQRRLRLGFVSPDLARHPVGYFLVRVLENLDPEQAETFCYSDRIIKDDLTNRIQAAATKWHDVTGMSDQRLAEQIYADQIDILFDLVGHTAKNRMLVFARKPAPIQVTWAGYVGTTGLKSMDYLLADRYEVPPGAERHYQERVLRMPEDYICYDPPEYAPPVAPLPALHCGHVTLCCFNNPAKITPQVVEVWAKILRRLPEARLVLKYKGWNDGGIARRFSEKFVAYGIEPGRLELLGSSPHAELMAEYNRIDLALDPFPYSGGLTTCEALWMGVPVITCPFETFASRHSLSHLSNVGLTETIAYNLDEYVDLAVSFASDLPRLAALRAGLRERMAASPLCDGRRFADNLMSLLRDAWIQWCDMAASPQIAGNGVNSI